MNEDAGQPWIEDFREDQNQHPSVPRINIPILYQSGWIYEMYHIGESRGTQMPMVVVIDKQGVVRLRTDWIHFDNTIDLIEELLYE